MASSAREAIMMATQNYMAKQQLVVPARSAQGSRGGDRTNTSKTRHDKAYGRTRLEPAVTDILI